ncbi:hypothetical protein [Gracilibacillus lacisalsi]|nr:hypothetical protein [Gracilibacillus lacisalsi]
MNNFSANIHKHFAGAHIKKETYHGLITVINKPLEGVEYCAKEEI